MRKGSTPFGACEVPRWRWLFGNKIPDSTNPSSCLVFFGRAGSVEWCRELIERKGVSIHFCDKVHSL